jgi:hypothetical protein
MSGPQILLSACSEASETWHYITRECEAFNKDSRLETAGHVIRTVLTFGTSAAISIPETERRIENHIIRLEKGLYELKKRVSRCASLSSGDDNIYELLIQVERKRFGSQQLLSSGFKEDSSDSEYRCNIGEVSFHLIEARSFWRSASNSIQDLGQRHKMVCRSKRLLEESLPTPRLATMPHTPIAQKLKDFIDTQIKEQVGNIDDFAAAASKSLKEAIDERPNLQKLLSSENIDRLKGLMQDRASKSGPDKANVIDVDAN